MAEWFWQPMTFDTSLADNTKDEKGRYTSGGMYSAYSADNKMPWCGAGKFDWLCDENNEGFLYLTTNTTIKPYVYTKCFVNWSGREEYTSQTRLDTNQGYVEEPPTTTTANIKNETHNITIGNIMSDFTDDRIWEFSTNLPIFDENDTESIDKYKETGDTSGAINNDYLKINKIITRVYVDESKPPNLKFTWNIEDGEPPTNYLIEIYDITQYGEIPIKSIESSGSYSTTWGLLESIVQEQGSQKSYSIKCYFSYNNGTEKLSVQINRNGSYNPTSAHKGKHFLYVHRGTGESDDGYQDTEDDSNATDDNITVNISNMLTNTYKVTSTQLKAVGNFLWASDFFDNIKLVNNNPIENIISCKAMPINADGTNTTISMGNVNSGVAGIAVNNNYFKKTIGSITVPRIYNNFVDFEHCQITLYLPLIGLITDLSSSEVVGYTITLKYCFDLITGDCLAMVFNNRGGGENCLGTYKGNCGIDIPLTASNRAQVQAGYISDFVGGVSSIVTKDVAGVASAGLGALTRQYTNRTSGSVSGVTAQGLPKQAYLTLVENATQIPSNYAKTYGRPCNLTKKLKDLSGFTICDKNIRLSSIKCTQEEKEEIRNLLSEGVIL